MTINTTEEKEKQIAVSDALNIAILVVKRAQHGDGVCRSIVKEAMNI